MDEIYLAQTDTTVGFLSPSSKKLNIVKNRSKDKQFLTTTTKYKNLLKLVRIPKKFKKLVRRSKKTTFIYPNNKAVRVVKDTYHESFLEKFDFIYSTSANESGKPFDRDYAFFKADIVVEDKRGFDEKTPSRIIKLSKNLKKKLR